MPSVNLIRVCKIRLPSLLGVLVGVLLLPSWALAETVEYVMITNPETTIADISRVALDDLFLGKTDTLAGMGKATPIHAHYKSEAYRAFVYAIHQSTIGKIKQFWAKRVMDGKGSPPRSFQYYEEIIQYVEQNRGTISYIPQELVNPKIKVLTLEGKPSFVDPSL